MINSNFLCHRIPPARRNLRKRSFSSNNSEVLEDPVEFPAFPKNEHPDCIQTDNFGNSKEMTKKRKETNSKDLIIGIGRFRGNQSAPKIETEVISKSTQALSNTIKNNSAMSDLQLQFKKKLEGARFRTINEELYTSKGESAFKDFQQNPDKFDIYHRGYREQAAQWPINPLDLIIQWIQKKHPKAIVADMGCGDARLAETICNKVHSFDLVSTNEKVVACNIAHVPLPNNSVDIVVFCLSLMGTNYYDFIAEAHRVLKPSGFLKVVEVRSRFENDTGIIRFITFLEQNGFKVKKNSDLDGNVMFFGVEGQKVGPYKNSNAAIKLKACQYKKR